MRLRVKIRANTGVNFEVTEVIVELDLTGDFVERDDIETSTADVQVTYPIKSCPCDDNGDLVDNTADVAVINQGESLQFCVESDSAIDGITVTNILTTEIKQTVDNVDTTLTTIENAKAMVTYVTLDCTTKEGVCRVKTTLPNRFFFPDTTNVSVTGTAIISFVAANSRRQLRAIPTSFDLATGDRNLQQQLETSGGTGEFDVAATLGAAESSAAGITAAWSVASAIGGLLM